MAKTYMEILEERGIRPFLNDEAYGEIQSFDPVQTYALADTKAHSYESRKQYQLEIGRNSNLISDMCWYGATSDELVSVIKHGMVLAAAWKYPLDWKQSAADHGVDQLRKEYRRFQRNAAFTEREKLVISAYTGFSLVRNQDKVKEFIEQTLGHPIQKVLDIGTGTWKEMSGVVAEQLHDALKDEFCEICRKHHVFGI